MEVRFHTGSALSAPPGTAFVRAHTKEFALAEAVPTQEGVGAGADRGRRPADTPDRGATGSTPRAPRRSRRARAQEDHPPGGGPRAGRAEGRGHRGKGREGREAG